jgi:hypothetical protein
MLHETAIRILGVDYRRRVCNGGLYGIKNCCPCRGNLITAMKNIEDVAALAVRYFNCYELLNKNTKVCQEFNIF